MNSIHDNTSGILYVTFDNILKVFKINDQNQYEIMANKNELLITDSKVEGLKLVN